MRTLLASLIVGAAVTTTSLAARADGAHGVTYNVTVTNLTVGESFTPFLVASHRAAAHPATISRHLPKVATPGRCKHFLTPITGSTPPPLRRACSTPVSR